MTLIFDFDGTIAQSLELMRQAFNKFAPEFGLPLVTEQDFEMVRNHSTRELIQKYRVSPITIARFSLKVRKEMATGIHSVQVVTGLQEVLEELVAGSHELGIITSNSQKNVEVFLQRNRLEEFSFLAAEYHLLGKANKLKKVLRQRNLSPQKAVYIGDEVRDIDAAHGAGLRCISVTWGLNSSERLQKGNPDFLVHHPKELLTVVKQLSSV